MSMMESLRVVDHCLLISVNVTFRQRLLKSYVERIIGIIRGLRSEHNVRVLSSAMFEVSSHILGMCLFFLKNDGPWYAREVFIVEHEAGTHCDGEMLLKSRRVAVLNYCVVEKGRKDVYSTTVENFNLSFKWRKFFLSISAPQIHLICSTQSFISHSFVGKNHHASQAYGSQLQDCK